MDECCLFEARIKQPKASILGERKKKGDAASCQFLKEGETHTCHPQAKYRRC